MKNPVFKIVFMLLATFTISLAKTYAQTSDKIVGTYWSPKKTGKVEIYKSGEKYFGRTIWGSNPRKDTKNPNPELRSRDVVGMTFLTNFSFEDGEYVGGEIYDPEKGKTYSSKMWLENGNLRVRGFIGISLLGRTETFEKIK